MIKRVLAAALLMTLVLSVQPAGAAKKKSKKPKPYKSQQVTITLPRPALYNTTGAVQLVTAKEFETTCALPKSNGLDAYVFEVPKAYQSIVANAEAIGAAATPAGYDLDMFFYSKTCKLTLGASAAGTDEGSAMPKGTAWILVNNYLGEPGVKAHIQLSA